jgi:hypothetical protein
MASNGPSTPTATPDPAIAVINAYAASIYSSVYLLLVICIFAPMLIPLMAHSILNTPIHINRRLKYPVLLLVVSDIGLGGWGTYLNVSRSYSVY